MPGETEKNNKHNLCPMKGCQTILTKGQELSVCSDCNIKYPLAEIAKVLKENTVKTLREYHNNLVNINNEAVKQFIQELQEREDINDKQKIIKLLEFKYKFYCDKSNKDFIVYVWNGKLWENNTEQIIRENLIILFEDKTLFNDLKKIMNYLKGKFVNKLESKPPCLIACNNGFFDLDKKKLIPHDSKYFYTNIIPHNYNPKAKCKNWLKTLNNIHKKEDLDFIQEWWGYNLYTSYPIKAFLICIGSGNNGKTIELTTIQKIVGENNNSTMNLQDLTYSHFGIVDLYQRLTNISDEIPSNRILSSGKLRAVVDGVRIRGERKFGQPFDFTPYAKITYACNEPPEIEDNTDATWDRMKFIDFPYKFVNDPLESNEKKQEYFKDELLTLLEKESEGILNYMIEGLLRLKDNRFNFSYNLTTEQVRENYNIKSNPVVAWQKECFQYTSDEENDLVFQKDLYEHGFLVWAKRNNIKNITADKFFKDLKNKCQIIPRQSKIHDMQRVYFGRKSNDVTTYLNNITLKDNNKQSIDKDTTSLPRYLNKEGTSKEDKEKFNDVKDAFIKSLSKFQKKEDK